MKKLSLFILLFIPALLFAQEQTMGNLTIFSENGMAFYVFLDGKKQNDIARTNVCITNLEDLYYNVKVIFTDQSIAPVVKNNLPVSDGDDVMKDVSYRIRLDKGGKPRLYFYSMLNVLPGVIPPSGTYLYRFNQPSSGMIVEPQKSTPVVTSTGLGTLHVFSQNGDSFYLFLDGIKQNDIARSNIRIGQLSHAYYNIKIVFPGTGMPDISKNNVSVADADDVLMNVAYRIRKDKAGKAKLNFYSIDAAEQSLADAPGMFAYTYRAEMPVLQEQHTINTTKTNSFPVVKNDSNKVTRVVKKDPVKISAPVKATIVANAEVIKKDETLAGKPAVVCNGWPMARSEFDAAKQTIQDATGNDLKLSTAKNIAETNCLLASQVRAVCNVLGSEELQIAFAKFAYRYTIDTKNYVEVINGLPSDTGKKEVTRFIKGG